MARPKGDFNLELLFRALADKTRLRLLNLMSHGEVCVCFFVEIIGSNQPKISRHLAYLRRAGIVAARREGQWMHYRITHPANAHAARVLNEVMTLLQNDPQMRRDSNRLVQVCCSPKPPVRIKRAPRPITAASRQNL